MSIRAGGVHSLRMLLLPRTTKELASDQAATLFIVRVLFGLSSAAAGWAVFDSHPTRRVVALVVAGCSALIWVIEAIGLSLELQTEREQHKQDERDAHVDERLLQLELRIAQVAADGVLTEEAQLRREWETLIDLTLEYIRDLQPGDTINVVSRSYVPPAGDVLSERFQFLFKQISDSPVPDLGYEVSGERRDASADDWTHERFFVSASNASTYSGLGTIRRVASNQKG